MSDYSDWVNYIDDGYIDDGIIWAIRDQLTPPAENYSCGHPVGGKKT